MRHFYRHPDAFDEHLLRCCPGRADLLPPRPRWPHRLLGAALLMALATLMLLY